MKKYFWLVIFLVLTTALLANYIGQKEKTLNQEKTTVTKSNFSAIDSRGKEINLNKKPTKIISLAPGNTEILFGLGLDEEIIGVTDYCDFPEKAKTKEKIGGFSTPNIEKIVSLNPDIVLATGGVQEKSVATLEELGIKVFVIEAKTIDNLLDRIKDVGKLLGKSEEAENLVNYLEKRIEAVKNKIGDIPETQKPKVFIEIWSDPLMTTGVDTFIHNVVELAGGKNIFDLKGGFQAINVETVIEVNPDVILLSVHGETNIEELSNRPGWQTIKAIKNKRVYPVNPDAISRPGPRLVDALEEVAKILYPETQEIL